MIASRKVEAEVTLIADGRFAQIGKSKSSFQVAEGRIVSVSYYGEEIALRAKNDLGRNVSAWRNDNIELQRLCRKFRREAGPAVPGNFYDGAVI